MENKIRSVDFRILARGRGIVNWNGTSDGLLKDGNTILPKLRNLDLSKIKGVKKDGEEYTRSQNINDVAQALNETRLYVSQNCLRAAIFEDECYALVGLDRVSDADILIPTLIGMLRGYALQQQSQDIAFRRSPLYISDLEAVSKGGLSVETLTTKGPRDSSSFYNKVTAGDVSYSGIASINIDELRFISLDGIYGRAASTAKSPEEAVALAKRCESALGQIAESLGHTRFSGCVRAGFYRRTAAVVPGAEYGLYFDDPCIDVLVEVTRKKLSELRIVRTKGYLETAELNIDFNPTHRFRLEDSPGECSPSPKTKSYATTYREATTAEVDERKQIMSARSEQAGEKSDEKKTKKRTK